MTIIDDKSDKMFSKKNGKAYFVYTLGSKKYTVWEERNPEWCAFDKGDNVDITDAQNGEFWNLTGMIASTGVPIETAPAQASNTATQPNLNAVGTVMNISDKPHSYEVGKSGERHKIYYNTVEELKEHLEALRAAELYMNPEDFGKDE